MTATIGSINMHRQSSASPDGIAKLGNIFSRDYSIKAARFIGWLRHPLPILLLAAVAAALCGLYLHPRAFAPVAGLSATLAAGIAWPWLSVRGLSGTLSFDGSRPREGEPVAITLSLRNRMPWNAWGLAIDGLIIDRGGSNESGSGGVARAAGWRTTTARWEQAIARRGEYPRGEPRVASGFPFGLWTASRPLAVPSRLLIWPRTFPVGPLPEAAGEENDEGQTYRDRAGHSGELLGVRPYRRGDSIRRIHWPQTAKHGELVVCELQSPAVSRAQIVLDIHPDGHASDGPDGSLEWSIRIAASFAEGWIAQGARVEVIFGDRAIPAGTGPIRSHQARILDALARLEPDARHPLAEVLAGPACSRFGAGLRAVIATDIAFLNGIRHPPGPATERFVVLDAAGFGYRQAPPVPRSLPFRPWIRIDGPRSVPKCLRASGKEGPIGR